MAIFGRANDPIPWRGRLLREERQGSVVQRGSQAVYLRRELSAVMEGELTDPALWWRWRQSFKRPERMRR